MELKKRTTNQIVNWHDDEPNKTGNDYNEEWISKESLIEELKMLSSTPHYITSNEVDQFVKDILKALTN